VSPLLLLACNGEPEPLDEVLERGEVPAFDAPAPVLRRLTQEQYTNSLDDLFGEGLVLPKLEPDIELEGLYALGAAVTSASPYGVEQYESAAFSVAEQVMAERSDLALSCEPEGLDDEACASQSLGELGRRVWRRPLTQGELDVLVDLVLVASETLEDFDAGYEYGIAALLQSPHFLYRIEGGSDGAYTDWEMATRLSYFLWNTTPDEELLLAAEAGELTDDAGLAAQVDRMLEDERAQDGVRNLFAELWSLYELDELSKDPTLFLHMSDQVGPSAREETLLGVEHLVFDLDGDYTTIFTTRTTFLDRTMAALYEVPAPEREGFGETELPKEGGRRGFLGQASFLALQAHPVSTSVTKRGQFLRERVLCHIIPPPPSDVDTSIPEASDAAPTMRERVARHLEDPSCASCHEITDPVGLGLENFDGIGRWRSEENGVAIDPSGDVDGDAFATAWELGGVIAAHPDLGPCLVERTTQYATGNVSQSRELMNWHEDGFEIEGNRVLFLLRDVALSPAFRQVGGVE